MTTMTSAAMRHATARRLPIWALAVILLAALAAALGGCHATAEPAGEPAGERVLAPHCTEAGAAGATGCTWAEIPPCPDDGGAIPAGESGCYWDASAHGDGRGQSFTVWADDPDADR